MDHQTLRGVIAGDAIQLIGRSRFPNGTAVELIVTPATTSPKCSLADLYGVWADDAEELDAYIEGSRQQRRIERRPQE
jgi:hypothetical protein